MSELHLMRAGETFSIVAEKHKMSFARLKEINRWRDGVPIPRVAYRVIVDSKCEVHRPPTGTKIGTLDYQVRQVLQHNEATRNSDITLTIELWKKYHSNRIVQGRSGRDFMASNAELDKRAAESIEKPTPKPMSLFDEK